jgi:type II secretory pathway pseudopilin PulG
MRTCTPHHRQPVSKPHPKQRGISLVEAATAVVIVSVLVAVAVPRFTEHQSSTRSARVVALAGAMKAASGLIKSSAIAMDVPCALETGTQVVAQGAVVALNHCYPQALGEPGTGILAAAQVGAEGPWVISNGSSNGGSSGSAAPGSSVTLTLRDSPTPASCAVTYTSARDAHTPPRIATSVSGC